MSAEENKAVVRRFFESFKQGDPAALGSVLADSFVAHNPFQGQEPTREGMLQLRAAVVAAFSDQHTTIEDLIAEGDKVVARHTHSGTLQGEFLGIPPTGRHGSFTGIEIFRIANGTIVEWWRNEDDLGFLQQLGVIPHAEQAGA
jgi:steroid delta-isomerase-like uncharacterized protein